MHTEPQSETAIRFYESRTRQYDDTWHKDFAKRFVAYLDIQSGQDVLDLACGTGLVTLQEAEIVGPSGSVVGVDVTPGMLAIASRKKDAGGEKYLNVSLYNGDVLNLSEVDALKGKTFDVITVASALVLFPDPKMAIEHWSEYLKPGGILAVDATHPRNLVSGMVLERVARRLNLPISYNRSWSRSESTLREMLESAGLEVESVVTVHNQAGYGKRQYDMEQWDDFFVENVIVKNVANIFANHEIRGKAQGVYKEEWEKLAVDGKVEEVDAVFLGIARKPTDGSRYVSRTSSDKVVFKGGCRCGGVQYASTETPSEITVCHCRACQQLSGAGALACTSVLRTGFQYVESSTLKTLKLSEVAERSFCGQCGTPISIAYTFTDSKISMTMGSIDLSTMACEVPKVKMHIYLCEKAAWEVLPDDGAERWGTWESAHLVVPKTSNT